MADKIRVLLTEEEVNKRISEVAEQINRDYAGKTRSFNLYLKGRRIFHLRAGETSGFVGFP